MSREDYIEVSERIQTFYKQFPDGSLQTEYEIATVMDQPVVIVKAYAYRNPDDARPGIGHAWEQIPGRTPFTRGSELMNGETSAWGRAIAALGIAVHRGIATGDEVRAAKAQVQEKVERLKTVPNDDPFYDMPPPPEPRAMPLEQTPSAPRGPKPVSPKQLGMIHALMKDKGSSDAQRREIMNHILIKGNHDPIVQSTKELTMESASYLITKIKSAAILEVDP